MTLTDQELMARFCDGDEGAFDVLLERHQASLHGFLFRLLGDAEQTRDVLQVTLLSMVRSRFRYRLGSPVPPWLFTIAANAARDTLRRDRRAQLYLEHEHVMEHEVEPCTGDPRLRERLQRALDTLTGGQRAAVVLREVQGWSYREIARSAGITETAARIRAHRGYARLRHLLTAAPPAIDRA